GSRRCRAEAGVETMTDALLGLYHELLTEARCAPVDSAEELRAAALYLHHLMPFRRISELTQRIAQLEQEREHWRSSAETAHAGWAELHREYERVVAECRRL